MLEKFVNLKDAILKTAKDLDMSLDLDDWDFENLEMLIQALIPIKIGTEKLCKRDVTLLDADAVFRFMVAN